MKRSLPLLLTGLMVLSLLFSCKSKGELPVDESSTLLVQLNDLQYSNELEKNYSDYDLKQQRIVSRPMNIVLYSFNTRVIQDSILIRLLKSSEFVLEAQPNRKVELRN